MSLSGDKFLHNSIEWPVWVSDDGLSDSFYNTSDPLILVAFSAADPGPVRMALLDRKQPPNSLVNVQKATARGRAGCGGHA